MDLQLWIEYDKPAGRGGIPHVRARREFRQWLFGIGSSGIRRAGGVHESLGFDLDFGGCIRFIHPQAPNLFVPPGWGGIRHAPPVSYERDAPAYLKLFESPNFGAALWAVDSSGHLRSPLVAFANTGQVYLFNQVSTSLGLPLDSSGGLRIAE